MAVYPKVLFFTEGMVPTDEEKNAANEYGPGVVFRNSEYISAGQAVEDCDGVAGNVPPQYVEAFPNVSDSSAVQERFDARRGVKSGVVPDETDEQRTARVANEVSRGASASSKDRRLMEPKTVDQRMSQSAGREAANLAQQTGSTDTARANTPATGTAAPSSWRTEQAAADQPADAPAPEGEAAPEGETGRRSRRRGG